MKSISKNKIFVLLLLLLFNEIIFSQNTNIQNAYNEYRYEDRDGKRTKISKAKEYIDLAYVHETTSNAPKMWNYRSKIYLEIMINHAELDADAVFKATEAYIRCLDKDKKGRSIVRKWTREEDVLDGLIQCGYKLFNSGVADYNAKKYNDAINKYQEIFKIIPLDKDNLLKRGNIVPESIYKNMYLASFQLKDLEMQIDFLQKSIDISTNDPSIYVYISKAYEEKGDLDKSLSYLQDGKDLFESEPMLINSEIDLLIKMGESNQQIINKLSQAIEFDDLNDILYVIRASRYMDEELFDEAEEDLNFVINEIDPNSIIAMEHFTELYNLQIMKLENKIKFDKLSNSQTKLIKNNLNELYSKTLPYLIKYVENYPDSKPGLNNLATIYYKLGMEKESMETRDKLNLLK